MKGGVFREAFINVIFFPARLDRKGGMALIKRRDCEKNTYPD